MMNDNIRYYILEYFRKKPIHDYDYLVKRMRALTKNRIALDKIKEKDDRIVADLSRKLNQETDRAERVKTMDLINKIEAGKEVRERKREKIDRDIEELQARIEHAKEARIIQKKWGTHPDEFAKLGPKLSKALSTTKDSVGLINSIIEIGNTVAQIIKTIYGWKTEFSRYIKERDNRNSLHDIAKQSIALAGAYLSKDPNKINKVVAQIRGNKFFQGIGDIREMYATEIILAFASANIENLIEDAFRKVFKEDFNLTRIQKIFKERGNLKSVEAMRYGKEDIFIRNIRTYSRV